VAPHGDAGLLELLDRGAEACAARDLDLDRILPDRDWRAEIPRGIAGGRDDGENYEAE
jgi:hypothetical protein